MESTEHLQAETTPVNNSQADVVTESTPKEPEPTMNKQRVSYMSVKEVISSAKSIDIQTASVSLIHYYSSCVYMLCY